MEWDESRRLLVAKLLADGFSNIRIGERLGITAAAVRAGIARYGLAEDLRGTRIFVTARGKRVRKAVKPRRPAKVSLAPVRLG